MKKNTVKLCATAYHEAGHAVVACHLGVGMRKIGVTIIPGNDYAGACASRWTLRGRPDYEYSDALRRRAEKQVMVMLAGMEAQRKFSSRSVRRHHGESDYSKAVGLLDYFASGPDDLEAYMERLRLETKGLVETCWQDISTIADALLQRKSLSGSEVMALVNVS